jgi:hypothetical protein
VGVRSRVAGKRVLAKRVNPPTKVRNMINSLNIEPRCVLCPTPSHLLEPYSYSKANPTPSPHLSISHAPHHTLLKDPPPPHFVCSGCERTTTSDCPSKKTTTAMGWTSPSNDYRMCDRDVEKASGRHVRKLGCICEWRGRERECVCVCTCVCVGTRKPTHFLHSFCSVDGFGQLLS